MCTKCTTTFNDIPSLYKKLYLNPSFIHKSISDIFQSSKAIFGAAQYYKNGVLLMVLTWIKSYRTPITEINVSVKQFQDKKKVNGDSVECLLENTKIKFYCMKATIYDGERNHKSWPLSPGQEWISTVFSLPYTNVWITPGITLHKTNIWNITNNLCVRKCSCSFCQLINNSFTN